MNLLSNSRRIAPEWPLRIGLGFMYIYSGISLIRNPVEWVGFLPPWFAGVVGSLMPLNTYLLIQGLGELMIALIFLGWFLPRWLVRLGTAVAAIEMVGIVLLAGVDFITFRDLGLLGGTLALFLLTSRGELACPELSRGAESAGHPENARTA